MKPLTPKQKKLLGYIERYQLKNGPSPTIREMREYFKVNSDNSILKHLIALEKKGYIQRDDTPRGIQSLESVRERMDAAADLIRIPLLGTIPAGGPVMAEENILGTYEIGRGLMPSDNGCFLLRVSGNSMIDAGIHEKDMVLVNPKKEARPEDIVVALVDGENTVKRYKERNGIPYLQAENPDYADIHPERSLEVQGVVVGLVRSY